MIDSQMRSKGYRFTLEVWGWRCVRWTVPTGSQPLATVRTRPYVDRMGVPMVSSAKCVILAGFKRHVAPFRVAGVALRDMWTCLATCRKAFCLAGAILLRRCCRRCVLFFVAGAAFPCRRSTSDVPYCLLAVNRIVGAARSGDKVQIVWHAWHFVRYVEIWRKLHMKHRF